MKFWLSGLILLFYCLAFAQTHYGSEDKPVIVASTTQIADFDHGPVTGDLAGKIGNLGSRGDDHRFVL